MKNYILFYQEDSIHVLADFVNKEFLIAASSRKIKIHVVESQITLLVWTCLLLTLFIFIRTSQFWLSLSLFVVFPNFRLICSYFVLVKIIVFDLALHICIHIIHAEYFGLVMVGFNEKVYTLILTFMYITLCLLTEPKTMFQLKILMTQTLLLL